MAAPNNPKAAENLRAGWKPGESGNPSGRPKDRLRPYLILEAAKLTKRNRVEITQGEALAANLFRLALSNRMVAVPAAKLILEYVDGKPTQPVAVSGQIDHVQIDTARTLLRIIGGTERTA